VTIHGGPPSTTAVGTRPSASGLDEKRARLGALLDPVTFRGLERLGVAPGWSCAEVGGGTGAVASWLSARVGLRGRVVATDVDTRFLDRLALANVEVRHADICTVALDRQAFDLVHTRLVLMHVEDRAAALCHLVDAVRVGGWLCIEEPDFSVMTTHPRVPAVQRVIRALVHDFDQARSDWRYGLSVPAACERAGVTGIVADGQLSLLQFGTGRAEALALFFEGVGPRLVGGGYLARPELDEAVDVVRTPSTTVITSPLIISTVARKR